MNDIVNDYHFFGNKLYVALSLYSKLYDNIITVVNTLLLTISHSEILSFCKALENGASDSKARTRINNILVNVNHSMDYNNHPLGIELGIYYMAARAQQTLNYKHLKNTSKKSNEKQGLKRKVEESTLEELSPKRDHESYIEKKESELDITTLPSFEIDYIRITVKDESELSDLLKELQTIPQYETYKKLNNRVWDFCFLKHNKNQTDTKLCYVLLDIFSKSNFVESIVLVSCVKALIYLPELPISDKLLKKYEDLPDGNIKRMNRDKLIKLSLITNYFLCSNSKAVLVDSFFIYNEQPSHFLYSFILANIYMNKGSSLKTIDLSAPLNALSGNNPINSIRKGIRLCEWDHFNVIMMKLLKNMNEGKHLLGCKSLSNTNITKGNEEYFLYQILTDRDHRMTGNPSIIGSSNQQEIVIDNKCFEKYILLFYLKISKINPTQLFLIQLIVDQ